MVKAELEIKLIDDSGLTKRWAIGAHLDGKDVDDIFKRLLKSIEGTLFSEVKEYLDA